MHPSKRKLVTEAVASGIAKSSSSRSAGSGARPRAGIPEKLTQSKPKHKDADDDCPATSQSQPPTEVKRGRTSTSQGGSTNGSSSREGKRRSGSASSGESKAARRSGRSPTRPSRSSTEQKRKQPGKTGSGKPKEKPSAANKPKGKPTTSSAAKAGKEKSLGETRLEALQRLDSMLTIPKPPEVQVLLLENMSEADVLATFEGYRSDFDKLFEERKNEAQTDGYMDVGHMDVMDILNKDIRYKMITKLGESFRSTRSSHASLVINGLLPLWIVLLFTDTYNLSHGDAVRQIKAQLRWSTYLKALNDEPLDADLDD